MSSIWQKIWQNKRKLICGIVIAGIAIAGVYFYGDKNKPVVTGQTVQVERGDIISLVSATGTIKPVDQVDISSKITGRIKEVKVRENEQVKVGQILLILDDEEYRAQVSQAYARLTNAEANYWRNRRLNDIGASSDQQLDEANMSYVVAKASYDDAVSQLNDTVITAPLEGTVIGKPIPAGQTVAPGISNPMVLLTVADLSQMQVETQIDETDIGKIVVGQKAVFTVDAFPGQVFHGIVSNISRQANVQQNVVYYTVLIDVDGEKVDLLKPTMTARVSVHVDERKNTIIIPLSVIKFNKNEQYVQVLKNGQIQNISIITGLVGEDGVEVVNGLDEGDIIVLPSQGKAPAQQSANSPLGMPGVRVPRR